MAFGICVASILASTQTPVLRFALCDVVGVARQTGSLSAYGLAPTTAPATSQSSPLLRTSEVPDPRKRRCCDSRQCPYDAEMEKQAGDAEAMCGHIDRPGEKRRPPV
jgi:hypothetical protein